MTRRFENRVAAVIGGGSGMGRAICHRLAAEGAHVHVADLNGGAAKTLTEEILCQGHLAQAEEVNATSLADLRGLFDRIGQQHGRLHVLHNQVGMPGPAGLSVTEEDWQRNIDVNVKSAFYGASLG